MAELDLRSRGPTQHPAGEVDGDLVETVGDDVQRVLSPPPIAAVDAHIEPCPVIARRGGRCLVNGRREIGCLRNRRRRGESAARDVAVSRIRFNMMVPSRRDVGRRVTLDASLCGAC